MGTVHRLDDARRARRRARADGRPRLRGATGVAALGLLAVAAAPAAAAAPWGPLERIPGSDQISTVEGPFTQIAVNRHGAAVAAWQRDDASVIAAYRPAGGPWGPARVLSAKGADGVQVGIDDRGRPTLLWTLRRLNVRTGVVQVAGRSARTGRLGGTHRIASAEDASLGVAPGGEALVALEVAGARGRGQVRLGTLGPGTLRLGPTRRVSTPAEDANGADLHLGPRGAAAVSWESADRPRVSVRPRAGAGFGAPATLSVRFVAPIAVGPAGRLAILSRDAGAEVGDWVLYGTVHRAGAPPRPAQRLSVDPVANPGTASATKGTGSFDVVFGARGDALAVWIGEIVSAPFDGPKAVVVPQAAYLPPGATTWRPAEDLDQPVTDPLLDDKNHWDTAIGATVGPQGDLAAVWVRAGEVRSSVRPAGATAWPAPTALGGPTRLFRVADLGAGRAVAVWAEGNADERTLTAAVRSTGAPAFGPAEPIGAAVFGQLQLAAGPAGRVAALVAPTAERVLLHPQQLLVAFREPVR